jgi:hypothetical protein
MTEKPTRGGKREGAGRKLSGREKRDTRSLNLEPSAWSKIDAKAAANDMSASDLVNGWAKRLRPGKINPTG